MYWCNVHKLILCTYVCINVEGAESVPEFFGCYLGNLRLDQDTSGNTFQAYERSTTSI